MSCLIIVVEFFRILFVFSYSYTLLKLLAASRMPFSTQLSKSERTLFSNEPVAQEDLRLGARAPSPCSCFHLQTLILETSLISPSWNLTIFSHTTSPSLIICSLLFFQSTIIHTQDTRKTLQPQFWGPTILTTWHFLQESFSSLSKVIRFLLQAPTVFSHTSAKWSLV